MQFIVVGNATKRNDQEGTVTAPKRQAWYIPLSTSMQMTGVQDAILERKMATVITPGSNKLYGWVVA
jgi:hypothetical protein